MEDQLPRQGHFLVGDLVQRINLRVIHDRHVEAVVHRFVHEDRIQHSPRICVQTEGNIAYTEDRLYLGQLFLDPLDRVQRLDARCPVVVLTGRDRQREGVENQVHRPHPVFVHRQVVDALGDCDLLVRSQGHAVFVDGQRDHRRAVLLRHRQHFRRALLPVFQVDGVDDRLARDPLQALFDDVRFRRIQQYRRGHARRDPFQHVADVDLFVLTHDRAAQVEHVRAFVDQLFGHRQDRVVIPFLYQVAELHLARRRVHLFRDDQRLRLQVQRHHRVRARRRAHRFHVALRRLQVRARRGHDLDVLRRCPAAPADQPHPVIRDEVLVKFGQFPRLQLVHCPPALVLRQARVWQHRHVLRRIQSQVAHRVIHLLGTGGTVQSDDVDVEQLQRGQRRADLRPQQHRARGFQRHLNLHRQALARLLHRLADADDCRLRLQNVLAGLDQEHVHSALNQPQRLLRVALRHRVEADVPQRWQLRGRPHRPGNKSRLPVRELLRDFLRQLRRRPVDLVRLVLQLIFGEHHAGSPERVRFHDVAARLKVRGMDLADHVRPAQHQQLVAALFVPVIIHRQVPRLD